MNESVLNETLLKKNIELLELYSDEEKEKLDLIFDKMNQCLVCYKTSNSSNFNKKVSSLKSNMPIIVSNRQEYIRILNEVIRIYVKTAEGVVTSARLIGDKIRSDLNVL